MSDKLLSKSLFLKLLTLARRSLRVGPDRKNERPHSSLNYRAPRPSPLISTQPAPKGVSTAEPLIALGESSVWQVNVNETGGRDWFIASDLVLG